MDIDDALSADIVNLGKRMFELFDGHSDLDVRKIEIHKLREGVGISIETSTLINITDDKE